MKYILIATILLLPALSSPILTQAQADPYNIVWDHPSNNVAGSMPCGGGDIGLNVWVENGDLLFYIARSGAFDENNALLKLGRVRIRLTPNPFPLTADTPRVSSRQAPSFQQELSLRDGSIILTSANGNISVRIRVWVDVFRPLIHVSMNSSSPVRTKAIYESWRYRDRPSRGRANNANSYKWAPQHAPGGEVTTYKDSIGFQKNDLVFYHQNKGPDVFDITVSQQGLDSVKTKLTNPLHGLVFGGMMRGSGMHPGGTVEGKYLDTDYRGWVLASDHPSRTQELELYCNTSQTGDLQDWQKGLQHTITDAQAHKTTAWSAVHDWWGRFWDRSFIFVQSSDPHSKQWEMGRNYQFFRYMLGCNAFGQYPTKFNGGLFTFDPSLTDTAISFTPDFRNWGGGTMTAQNQRLVYYPLIRSGDFDLLRSQLDLYRRLLPAAELRTAVYWGHGGASFTEQLENFGLPNAAEYGWNMPAAHDKGVEYNAWLEYEWDTVLEFCLMMLETQQYTGKDIHEYLPFVESCLRFFNEHYQYLARQRGRQALDGNGHLILYPGSAAETYKMAYNSSSTIAGLQTILKRLLELPDGYLNDTGKKEWTTMLHRLPPISFRSFQDHPTISPARVWERTNNTETPQLYPVFPWGIYGLGRNGLDTALNTWKYDTDVVKWRGFKGWRQDNIFAARLGLTEEAATLTLQKLQNGALRFPAFWGPGYDWTPDHNWGGSGMIGLQEMLMQTDGRKIFLFPAWPAKWDVHFKLFAPYNTTVEAELKNGRLTSLKVIPEERLKDLISNF